MMVHPSMPLPSQPRSRRRRILIGSSVSLATLAILFTLAEIGARLLVPEDVLSPYKPVYRRDPIAGYTLQPCYRGYSLGAWLEINSLGYRGPEWPLAKPPNTCRIALIGDSHAFGFGVPFASSVGEVL